MVEGSGSARFPLRRTFPGPALVLLSVGLGLVVSAGGVLLLVDPFPSGSAETGFLSAMLSLAGLSAALSAAWKAAERRRPLGSVELIADRILLPSRLLPGRRVDLPLRAITSIERWHSGRRRLLLLGLQGRFPWAVPDRSLVRPEDVPRLEEELRERIGRLDDGARRLAALERRAERARECQRGRRRLTFGFAALLAAAFVLQWRLDAFQSPLTLLALGASSPWLVLDGELHRLSSYALLHGSPLHFAQNFVVWLVLAGLLERLLGTSRLTVVAGVALYSGSVASSLVNSFLMSVGASATAFGLIGVLLFLSFFRWRETPARLCFPGWLWLIVLGGGLVVELLMPQVDHAMHLGGLGAGFALAPLVHPRGRDGPARSGALRRTWAALALLLALTFTAASGLALSDLRSAQEEGLRLAERLLKRPHVAEEARHAVAWAVAVAPDARSETLALARGAIGRESELVESGDADRLDTLATLDFRLGRLDRAIRLERIALLRKETRHHASQLARFEWTRLHREGVLCIGCRGRALPTLRMQPSEEGRGTHVVSVSPRRPFPQGAVLHAVAVPPEGLPRAHLRIWVEAGDASERRLRLSLPAGELVLRTTLVDAAPAESRSGWRLWPIDRRVFEWPGPPSPKVEARSHSIPEDASGDGKRAGDDA